MDNGWIITIINTHCKDCIFCEKVKVFIGQGKYDILYKCSKSMVAGAVGKYHNFNDMCNYGRKKEIC